MWILFHAWQSINNLKSVNSDGVFQCNVNLNSINLPGRMEIEEILHWTTKFQSTNILLFYLKNSEKKCQANKNKSV